MSHTTVPEDAQHARRAPAGTRPAIGRLPTARHSSRRIALAAGLIVVLVLLARLLLDVPVGRWAYSICETPWASAIRTSAVPIGGPLVSFVVALALFVLGKLWRWPQARRAGLVLPAAFIVSGGVTHLIKITVERPRPFAVAEGLPQETHWQRVFDGKFQSFPSGDVTVAAALATVCFLLAGSKGVAYLAFLVPAYSATARMVAARHYPSDCLAGFVVGALTAWLLWRYQERRWPLGDANEAPAGDPAG